MVYSFNHHRLAPMSLLCGWVMPLYGLKRPCRVYKWSVYNLDGLGWIQKEWASKCKYEGF